MNRCCHNPPNCIVSYDARCHSLMAGKKMILTIFHVILNMLHFSNYIMTSYRTPLKCDGSICAHSYIDQYAESIEKDINAWFHKHELSSVQCNKTYKV